jgi:hypothetical protein
MYRAPPSLALFTRMEEDEKLVDEAAADQKRSRETRVGLLGSSLKISVWAFRGFATIPSK